MSQTDAEIIAQLRLSWREIGRAIRQARDHGWDTETILVEREGEGG